MTEKKGGGPKRKSDQREYDLKEIARLYLQGWIQAEIAKHLNATRPYNITRQTIARDLKTIRERWLQSSIRDFDESRAQELARLDGETLGRWERSLEGVGA